MGSRRLCGSAFDDVALLNQTSFSGADFTIGKTQEEIARQIRNNLREGAFLSVLERPVRCWRVAHQYPLAGAESHHSAAEETWRPRPDTVHAAGVVGKGIRVGLHIFLNCVRTCIPFQLWLARFVVLLKMDMIAEMTQEMDSFGQ